VGKNREKAGWGKNLRGGGIKRRASTVPTLLNKRPFCYQFLIFKQITSLRASLVITPTPYVEHQKLQICTNLRNMNIKLTLSGHRDGRTDATHKHKPHSFRKLTCNKHNSTVSTAADNLTVAQLVDTLSAFYRKRPSSPRKQELVTEPRASSITSCLQLPNPKE